MPEREKHMFTGYRGILQYKGERKKGASCGFWTLKQKNDQLGEPRIIKWPRVPVRKEHEESKSYSLYKPETKEYKTDFQILDV